MKHTAQDVLDILRERDGKRRWVNPVLAAEHADAIERELAEAPEDDEAELRELAAGGAGDGD
jgi:hypothetical protein